MTDFSKDIFPGGFVPVPITTAIIMNAHWSDFLRKGKLNY
jgi:hypothetical protein